MNYEGICRTVLATSGLVITAGVNTSSNEKIPHTGDTNLSTDAMKIVQICIYFLRGMTIFVKWGYEV